MGQLANLLADQLEQTRAILLFVIVFGVWIGVIGSLLYRKNRLARWYDSVIWVLTGGLITFVLFAPIPLLPDSRLVGRLILLVWLVSLVGVVLNIFLLAQQKNGNKVWSAIASIGLVLLGFMISLPHLEQGRESARLAQCNLNLKRLGVGMYEYYVSNESFPAPQTGNPPHSFRVDLLPFLDQRALYDKYDMTAAWNAETNLRLARTVVPELVCPAMDSLSSEGFGTTSYAIPLVEQGIYAPDQPPLSLKMITERSATLLLVEDCKSDLLWAEPRDVIVVERDLSVTDSSTKNSTAMKRDRQQSAKSSLISSNHSQGANGLMVDGSVKRFSPNSSAQILKDLLSAKVAEPAGF